MKKLVLFAAIIAVVSLSACKKTATEETPIVEEEITVVEEIPVDSTVVVADSAVLEAAEVAE
jgi:hypothetical protein